MRIMKTTVNEARGGGREDGASNINVIQFSVFLYGFYTINYFLRKFHSSLEAVI